MADDAAFVRDRLEITNLIHSYAHCADSGDLAGFGALFAEDARIEMGPFPQIKDKPSLLAMLNARPPSPVPVKTRHVMTNLVFRGQSAREADGALYFTLMSTQANKLTPVVTGQNTRSQSRAPRTVHGGSATGKRSSTVSSADRRARSERWHKQRSAAVA